MWGFKEVGIKKADIPPIIVLWFKGRWLQQQYISDLANASAHSAHLDLLLTSRPDRPGRSGARLLAHLRREPSERVRLLFLLWPAGVAVAPLVS